MNPNQKTKNTPYVMLGLGIAVGGLAVASLPHIVPAAHAQQDVVARPIAGMTSENMATLRSLDNSFASLASYIEPSVVHIESKSNGTTDIMGRRTGELGGIGTGVIFRPDGWIVTNDHVVAGFDKVTVTLQDGRTFPGTVRRAPDNDIAVVKIDASNLPAAQFGDSTKVRTGQFAMAVGSPFNLDETVTIGHISALNRQNVIPDEHAPLGARSYFDLIQTDAPINMGNSGGPLVNVDGQVIGINSAIYSGTGGSVGIGFAIPANEARMLAETLISKGSVSRAYLGLVPEDLKTFQKEQRHVDGGAVASDVPNDGPAGMAGIQKDDLIVRVGDYQVRGQQDVRDSMYHYTAGETVPVEVIRAGQHKTFSVKLGDGAVAQQKQIEKMKQQQQSQVQQGDGQNPFGGDIPDIQQFQSPFPQMRPRGNGNSTPHTGKAKLGVNLDNLSSDLRSQFEIPADVQGAVVTAVAPGSIAEGIGIQAGCVIQQFDGKTIHSAQDFMDAMKGVTYGQTHHIQFGKFGNNSRSTESMDVQFK
jgi:serine protease Do